MSKAKEIKLSEYQPPSYWTEKIDLEFDLDPELTQVYAKQIIRRNDNTDNHAALRLNGTNIELKEVKIDGVLLALNLDYEVSEDALLIKKIPTNKIFQLEIKNLIHPRENKTLNGVYESGNIICTQNEAEGFRQITYYIDRPDNMAMFTTKIIADKKNYPTLLSNGNPIEKGDLPNGKHYVVWADPFKKPCYLYALVAGNLGVIKDTFKTMSGRVVDLYVYCDPGNEYKCKHAMTSLQKSMKWDEDRFGREYDLDIFMIVAVDSFNFGAMENKGLNIFNSALVLADPTTATDLDYYSIESVVGHEYFHNWTGNRITCKNWFQLTLKEGLTVFRDQEFSADMHSRPLERIWSISTLKSVQFAEDQGPMSHPIRPESYIEIDNFYTPTVYEKGAEVIRMIQTLLGPKGFRLGMDKYFELYDGQAVCTEDFLHAMSVANGNFDFSQFKRWYGQNGTPHVSYQSKLANGNLELEITQVLPKNSKTKADFFHFPLAIGLLSKRTGKQILEKTLEIKKEKEIFIFSNINEEVVISFNRHFSAPIKVEAEVEDDLFIMAHDNDVVNRYEAAQRSAISAIIKNNISKDYLEAFGKILADESLECGVKAKMLSIPDEAILYQEQEIVDIKLTRENRTKLINALANKYHLEFFNLYSTFENKVGDEFNGENMGKRQLSLVLLSYLSKVNEDKYQQIIWNKFKNANLMTNEINTLNILIESQSKHSKEASQLFYEKWKNVSLVSNKWMMAKASEYKDNLIDDVKKIELLPVFDLTIPNKVRSLYGAFAKNSMAFYAEDGSGFSFIGEKIIALDKINPQAAAGLARSFNLYKKLPVKLQEKMGVVLNNILNQDKISSNLFEVISSTLKN